MNDAVAEDQAVPLFQILHDLVGSHDEIAGQGDGRPRREGQRQHGPEIFPHRFSSRLHVQQPVRRRAQASGHAHGRTTIRQGTRRLASSSRLPLSGGLAHLITPTQRSGC